MSDSDNRDVCAVASAQRGVAGRFAPRMRVVSVCAIVAALILAAGTLFTLRDVLATQRQANAVSEEYQLCSMAVDSLQEASDFLTDEMRTYVATSNSVHLDNYLMELNVLDRRGAALEVLREHADSADALAALQEALTSSNELAQIELYAGRLMAQSYDTVNLPDTLASVELTDEDMALGPVEMRARAHSLMNGDEYNELKLEIREDVYESSELLLQGLESQIEQSQIRLDGLVLRMQVMVLLLLAVIALMWALMQVFLLSPMALHAKSILRDEPLEAVGASELRALTDVYNVMYTQNREVARVLDYEAHNDALTGILNRGSFDSLLHEYKTTSALLLVDVDNFKKFNDTWGHEMGDAILIEVAAILFSSFSSDDYVCRVGGDEFAVLVTEANLAQRSVIANKLEEVRTLLADGESGLPVATISVGVAFGCSQSTSQELYSQADFALYDAKHRGRNTYVFYDELETAA